jgi:rhodanese-related sulfurtransferase
VSLPPPIPSIDVTEAERRLRSHPAGPILLDVRETNEFVEVRAPGAVLFPTSVFMARVGELPADRPLLVVCHVGGRSAAVTGYLVRAGRTDVVNVAGGMEAWVRAGLPVRRGPVEPGEGEFPAD